MSQFAAKQKSFSPITGYKPNQALSSFNPGLVNSNASTLANMHIPLIQTKLTINQPVDKYEQEADRVAEEVTHMPDPTIQRKPT